jgi:4-hydroxy-3-methylbut-2-en-1-yl diphosphate reductase
VIGGRNSGNTKRLATIAGQYTENVFHIEQVEELDFKKIKKYDRLGITAGASTPHWIIDEAVSRLHNSLK